MELIHLKQHVSIFANNQILIFARLASAAANIFDFVCAVCSFTCGYFENN